MAGIVSPRSFVELELAYFEPLGIKKPEDRKKLFFLIQKVKSELDKFEQSGESSEDNEVGGYGVSPRDITTKGNNDRLAGYNPNQQPTTAKKSEVGLSVDMESGNMGPISPVTLGSPLRSNEYEIATGKTDEALKAASTLLASVSGNPTREKLKEELVKRREHVMKLEADKISTNSRNSNYTDDFDNASSAVPSRKSKRRSSMLPRISKSKEITTPQTISMGRTSLHSRPTIKKGNQSALGVGRTYSRDEEDESISSETSDLSSSIQSYSSIGSSSLAKTKGSRTSSGTYSSHTNENRQRIGMETKLNSRLGNKRLSTIPSSGVAPASPLAPLPGLSSNLDKRKSLGVGRPCTAGSTSSHKTNATNKSVYSAASSKSKSKLSRPSSRSSIGFVGGKRVVTTNATKATTAVKATSKSPLRGLRSPKSSTASTTRDRSVSPVKRPYSAQRVASPFRSVQGHGMSSARSIKTAGSVSPTRSIRTANSQRRGLSPMRRVQTPTSRDRSVTPSRTGPRSPTASSRTPPPHVKSPTNSGAVFVHGQAEDKSWGTQIAQLRDNFSQDHFQHMHGQKAYEEDDDYEMRIRVIVRKRPMSKREALESDVDVIHPLDYTDHGKILVYQPKTKLDLAKEVETTSFAFDNVFSEESNNMEIYGHAVRNLIPGVFRGKWASGKPIFVFVPK